MSDPLLNELPRIPLGRFGTDHYSCAYCNRAWNHDDPGFIYWRTYTGGPHRGMPMDGRDGRRRDSLGRFSHCANLAACERRRANTAAGVMATQLGLPGIEQRHPRGR